MVLPNEFQNHRLLLYYKGDISALTLFAQHENGSVCLPEPLPALSSILEEESSYASKVSVHPAVLVQGVNQLLNLDNDLLASEAGYCEYIDTPKGIITVYMARLNLLDPPHKMMSGLGYGLRTLPELRGRPPAEMELLRRAYVKVMES
jgi:hypothetical protein